MATAFSAAAAGICGIYHSVTAYTNRYPRSLAERLGEEGTARIKSCFRDVLLDARPQSRRSERSSMRIYLSSIKCKEGQDHG